MTHISNVLSTKELWVDVHKDINNPRWAITNVEVKKGAKALQPKCFSTRGILA
jgi:hypothetical protein